MARPGRTLLIVVVFGLVGVLALTWMARRYANLKPAVPAREEAPAPSPAPATEAAPPAAAGESAPSPQTAGPREEDLAEVDRFVAVRKALQQVIAEKPMAAKQLAEQLGQGDASQIKPLQLNLVFLLQYRLTREEAILKQGWTFEGYRALRGEFDAWRKGNPPADPGRAAAFEARRAALEGAVLDGLEALDRAADTGVRG